MVTVIIVLKNGYTFEVECKEFTASRSVMDGSLAGWDIKGCSKNIPLYVDVNEVAAIYQKELK